MGRREERNMVMGGERGRAAELKRWRVTEYVRMVGDWAGVEEAGQTTGEGQSVEGTPGRHRLEGRLLIPNMRFKKKTCYIGLVVVKCRIFHHDLPFNFPQRQISDSDICNSVYCFCSCHLVCMCLIVIALLSSEPVIGQREDETD